ncbi:glycogen debranching N-terminal domain-containing protein [Lysobacter arvi]|uniref:Glycogen debranching N-terminal domain-containing protein n=1 Tax=Lysobacter arvi TaxID=3038776 RepID=A0ABU1CAE1_9GAMM|nr:glycogen debranching N-terminal domain-containing protein [Lysobacter arvi]MDR0182159.1 glycogen debranching N-terminal domain-containing protein [Lysobacter arvi]
MEERFPVERSLIRLRVREHAAYVSGGDTVLTTGTTGFIDGGEEGLYVRQTRLLSRYRCFVGRRRPHPVTLSSVRQDSWMGYYIVPAPGVGDAEPDDLSSAAAQQTLELRISRLVGDGMREEYALTNFTQETVRFRLAIEVASDFADTEETRGPRVQKGKQTRRWRRRDDGTHELAVDYTATRELRRDGQRKRLRFDAGVTLQLDTGDVTPRHRDGRITFDVELAAHETWCAKLQWIARFGDETLPCPAPDRELDGPESQQNPQGAYLREATRIDALDRDTLAGVVDSAVHRARMDLAALRLPRFDRGPDAWTVAAGLPMYVALFGRDTLTTAQQVAMLGPEVLRGTLPVMVDWQAREDDPWRDEQPGRILHEAHPGPVAQLQYKPKDRYYGTLTGPGLFCTALAHLWQWTGDRDAVEPLIKPAMAALRWLDESACDRRHGFHAIATRTKDGLKNQTWKDSDDGIVEEDGRVVEHPVATCEEQGQAYAAKRAVALVLDALGEKREAARLVESAESLRQRFDEAYWMDDLGCYAMALGGDGHQVRSIGSNALRCVGSGIVPDERIPRLMERMFAPDMFSGWGIRTLSSDHPAYNPYAYHRGTVWPVEHGVIVRGCFHHGQIDRLQQVCRAQFEAASAFDQYRLPECFSGHMRDKHHPFPATYPPANSPQAWSASAVLMYVQSLLGLQPHASLGLLLVDPHLPSWLPALTVERLRVGSARVSLRFWRDSAGDSHFEVRDLEGELTVRAAHAAWRDVMAMEHELRERFAP